MTAEQFSAGEYSRQNEPQEREEGSFNTRVTVTEGTRTPSGLKAPVGSPDAGSVHRNSVTGYQHPKLDHKPYSTVHRPAQPATQQFDLQDLTVSQQAMLSTKGKAKHRKSRKTSS